MDKCLLTFVVACCLILVNASDLSIHDYDIQIHPIHGHHGHYDDHHGYATSVRYDKRYHYKVPLIPAYHEDVVYQYVADGHEEDGGHHLY